MMSPLRQPISIQLMHRWYLSNDDIVTDVCFYALILLFVCCEAVVDLLHDFIDICCWTPCVSQFYCTLCLLFVISFSFLWGFVADCVENAEYCELNVIKLSSASGTNVDDVFFVIDHCMLCSKCCLLTLQRDIELDWIYTATVLHLSVY